MSTSANLHQIYSFRSQKTFTTEALHTKELLHQSLSTQNSVYIRKPRNVHGKNSGLQSIIRTPRQEQPLSAKAFAAKFYTGRVLHQKVLTPQNLLGQRVFPPKCLDQTIFTTEDVYTSKRLHQRPFTLEAFCSRGTSHQRVFTPESFYRNFLHWGTFATKYVYAVHLLHQTSTVHQRVFTPKDFDTTKFCSRKLFWDVEPQTFHTNPFLQQTTLTTKMHFAPKTFYINELVHQRPSTPEAFSYTWFYAVLISPEHTYIWNFSQTVCTLYTEHFKTPENLYRGNLLQQRLNKVLHRTTLMLEALYTKEFSLQKAFT